MAKKTAFICLLALTVLWMGVIIGNSLQTGTESGEASSAVTQIINTAASTVGIKKPISESTVRTLAHFGEFALLAVLICADILLSGALSSRGQLTAAATLSLSVPCCLAFAMLDEFVQKFSDGRASDLADVLTDTLGALVGAALFIGVYLLYAYIHQKQRSHTEKQRKVDKK